MYASAGLSHSVVSLVTVYSLHLYENCYGV